MNKNKGKNKTVVNEDICFAFFIRSFNVKVKDKTRFTRTSMKVKGVELSKLSKYWVWV